jgi:hypothetical protein
MFTYIYVTLIAGAFTKISNDGFRIEAYSIR